MTTQMNPTDAEIAGKLEGMKRGNLQLDLFEGELWLTIRNKHRGVDIFVDGNVLPSDLLAFCREVVERVDGEHTPGQLAAPKVVVLCGSSKFCDIMAVCEWIIERDEKAITMGLNLLPNWYCREDIPDHLAEHEGVADEMDALHLKKIDLADEIFVVNYDDYIGKSTTREVEYAMDHGKKIRWFTHDHVGKTVDDIIETAIRTGIAATTARHRKEQG